MCVSFRVDDDLETKKTPSRLAAGCSPVIDR